MLRKRRGGGAVAIAEITLDKQTLALTVGETARLTATVFPQAAEDRTVVWVSSDEAVATVDDRGLVTAVAEGEAVITAQAGDQEAVCRIVVKIPAAIGDFYYADGTWSSELDETKTPVGIVFWVGDPTAQDPALRNDHPHCTNGLAVALNEYRDIVWSNNYDFEVGKWIEENTDCLTCVTTKEVGIPQNGIIGYNNTKGIEAYNAQAAENDRVMVVAELAEHSRTNLAPVKSSGWYMPSAKEVTLLFTGETEDISPLQARTTTI